MTITLKPQRGKERVEVVACPNTAAGLCLALHRSGLKMGYRPDPLMVGPGCTIYELSDGGTAEVALD